MGLDGIGRIIRHSSLPLLWLAFMIKIIKTSHPKLDVAMVAWLLCISHPRQDNNKMNADKYVEEKCFH